MIAPRRVVIAEISMAPRGWVFLLDCGHRVFYAGETARERVKTLQLVGDPIECGYCVNGDPADVNA